MPGGLGTPELVTESRSEGSLVGGLGNRCQKLLLARVKGDSNMEEGTAWEMLQGPGTLKKERGLAGWLS